MILGLGVMGAVIHLTTDADFQSLLTESTYLEISQPLLGQSNLLVIVRFVAMKEHTKLVKPTDLLGWHHSDTRAR